MVDAQTHLVYFHCFFALATNEQHLRAGNKKVSKPKQSSESPRRDEWD